MSGESATGPGESAADPPGSGAAAEPAEAAEPVETADPAAQAPPPPPGRWSRLLPAWARRRPLVTGVTAGVLAAAVIAAAVFLIVRPTVPQARYTSLPGEPCALISAADVAKYLPGAKGTPVSTSAGNTARAGVCKWSSTNNGENRTLIAQVDIFRSASAVKQAQQAYRTSLSAFRCHCPGVIVSTKAVNGLGDQATQAFVVARPTANFGTAPVASLPGASLVVQSSNAVIVINLDATDTATGVSQASPPSPAQAAGMTAMARDTLAVLDRPASAAPPPAASLAAEPHYAGRPDSCRLIGTATLARYLPGSTFTPLTPQAAVKPAASSASVCGWTASGFSAQLSISTYPGALAAGQEFQGAGQSLGVSTGGITVTGMRWLNDLGTSALASFRQENTEAVVDVVVWSGNAEFDVSYEDTAAGATSASQTAKMLAGATAMARDALAALGSPATSTAPPGPSYASPSDACHLVRTSTLARYAPGAGAGQPSGGAGQGTAGQAGTSICFWPAPSGFLNLEVTTFTDVEYARARFQFGVSFTHHLVDKVTGTRPVHGLGDQATAVFEIDVGLPKVELFVQSGNLVIDVSYADEVDAPVLSQAGKLAADIAMARDVLARLHRA